MNKIKNEVLITEQSMVTKLPFHCLECKTARGLLDYLLDLEAWRFELQNKKGALKIACTY